MSWACVAGIAFGRLQLDGRSAFADAIRLLEGCSNWRPVRRCERMRIRKMMAIVVFVAVASVLALALIRPVRFLLVDFRGRRPVTEPCRESPLWIVVTLVYARLLGHYPARSREERSHCGRSCTRLPAAGRFATSRVIRWTVCSWTWPRPRGRVGGYPSFAPAEAHHATAPLDPVSPRACADRRPGDYRPS